MASPPPGRIQTTSVRTLGLAALAGALGGWLLVVVTNALDLVPPLVPWTAPLAIVFVGALVGALAWSTHQQIQVRHGRIEPQRAVGFLVLGKASALVGALVAAGYLAFAVMFVTRLDAEGPRERVIRAGVAVLAGAGLMIAGLLLERACKVPKDPDDQPDQRNGARRERGVGDGDRDG